MCGRSASRRNSSWRWPSGYSAFPSPSRACARLAGTERNTTMVHMDLRERAAAKVNLSLLVGPMRPDGYHELLSVFSPIDLYDDLALSLTPGPAAETPGNIEVVCPGVAGENLVTRALRAVEAAGGVSIRGKVDIRKGVPVGAGLGGGSADAAAALRAAATALE